MKRSKGRARFVSMAAVLAAGLLPARAQEVGRFAVVQREVASLKPGAAAAVPAVAGGGIVLDEQESTGEASAAKMTFGEGAVISIGQKTSFKVTRQAVDEATGASVSAIDVALGKVRVFVSRFWSGRPEVRVNTPTAVVGIKGSEIVVEVLADGTTRVTTISGSATVDRPGAPGGRREIGPAQQLQVARGGTGLDAPKGVTADDIAALRRDTEPVPQAPGELPPDPPVEKPPAVADDDVRRGATLGTVAESSQGVLWSDPAANALPEGGSRGQPGQ